MLWWVHLLPTGPFISSCQTHETTHLKLFPPLSCSTFRRRFATRVWKNQLLCSQSRDENKQMRNLLSVLMFPDLFGSGLVYLHFTDRSKCYSLEVRCPQPTKQLPKYFVASFLFLGERTCVSLCCCHPCWAGRWWPFWRPEGRPDLEESAVTEILSLSVLVVGLPLTTFSSVFRVEVKVVAFLFQAAVSGGCYSRKRCLLCTKTQKCRTLE